MRRRQNALPGTDVCKKWRVPLAEDKTVFRTEMLTFLGIEIDTIAMELRLSQNKLVEIKDRILSLLNRKPKPLPIPPDLSVNNCKVSFEVQN
jgi:hypothetical protein